MDVYVDPVGIYCFKCNGTGYKQKIERTQCHYCCGVGKITKHKIPLPCPECKGSGEFLKMVQVPCECHKQEFVPPCARI